MQHIFIIKYDIIGSVYTARYNLLGFHHCRLDIFLTLLTETHLLEFFFDKRNILYQRTC
jgi:hypothetical protein